MNEVTVLVNLLRSLAGRLPDDDLATLRSLLAARELDDLERSLEVKIHYYGIDLSTEPHGSELRFVPADPDGSQVEHDLFARATRHPALRRIVKARRLQPPEAVVYVVEYAAGADVSRLQNALELDTALVEVVAEDEELPPYQAAALAAGRRIWPTGRLDE
ncbi:MULTISPECIES: hypothetical protein [unclassified Nocardia]|uniref:hypothetical protein n=1 Tax=unclassified Nocardia TaxID=2637762 RepID=UPI00278C1B64|nr:MULTISPECIES: hypothetical protein [unclassified Nocardia]